MPSLTKAEKEDLKNCMKSLSVTRKKLRKIFEKHPIDSTECISSDGELDLKHDDITKKVYRRLHLRHAILSEIEKLTWNSLANQALNKIYPAGIIPAHQNIERKKPTESQQHLAGPLSNPEKNKTPISLQAFTLLPPAVRAYNLAVTDLFVEKALSYLNRKAKSYTIFSIVLVSIALISISIACGKAFIGVGIDPLTAVKSESLGVIWAHLVGIFIKGFTFYGLMVLVAVYSYRMAKALLDQAERIKDRRHALRQGRLFVHLNGGMLTIEEMEKAFNWNVTQDNAFAHFNPDAQAPWGNVVKELMHTLRETTKSSTEIAKAVKKDTV